MRLGLTLGSFTWQGGAPALRDTLARVARTAEDAGFRSIAVMDHYFQIRMNGPAEQERLEGYAVLAFIAAHTARAELATMVTGVHYRHPGLLVKIVTTLDVLSGGRAALGIGAAWNEEESVGLGVPFPPLSERFERLEETLQIARQMWSGDETPFKGRHYQLERPLNSPQSLSRPHPRIIIGGSGERKTLRLVAQYADACNLFPGDIPHKLAVLAGTAMRSGATTTRSRRRACSWSIPPTSAVRSTHCANSPSSASRWSMSASRTSTGPRCSTCSAGS
jgi:F420-dependent oxidoreductase-like protein